MNEPEMPGYFDLQVNGYWGVDFNSDGLTAGELHLACERLRADGVAGILATLITDDIARMAARWHESRACARQTRSFGR